MYQDTVISSASHDEHGDFWIGSNFGRYPLQPRFPKADAHPYHLFTEVNMVQCDQRGKVWIGADNLLFAWLIQEQKFVLFGESNGAIQNEYLPNARLVNNEGDVYIGGVKGMLRIDGQLLLNTSEMPELQLLDITSMVSLHRTSYIVIRQQSLSHGTAISPSESCRKKRISSVRKSTAIG